MSKYRVITTKEELVALPDGSVIIDKYGDVAQLRDGLWCGYETVAALPQRQSKYLPAKVLFEGEAL